MSISRSLAEFEELTLKAIDHSKKKQPEKLITSRNLQRIITQFCKEKKIKEMNWKETGFNNVPAYLSYLQEKKSISLQNNNITLNESTSRKRPREDLEEKPPATIEPPLKMDLQIPKSFSIPQTSVIPSTLWSFFPPQPSKSTPNRPPINPFSFLPPPPEQILHRTKHSVGPREVINLCNDSNEMQKNGPMNCPICSASLKGIGEKELNQHIDECLTMKLLNEEESKSNAGTSPNASQDPLPTLDSNKAQFVIKVLDKNLDISCECSICFEPFVKGQGTARLECMCLFHEECFIPWFEKKKFCPLHIPKEECK